MSNRGDVTVLRLDIVLNRETLQLEADLQHGKLFDEDKVKPLAQKFLDDLNDCQLQITELQ